MHTGPGRSKTLSRAGNPAANSPRLRIDHRLRHRTAARPRRDAHRTGSSESEHSWFGNNKAAHWQRAHAHTSRKHMYTQTKELEGSMRRICSASMCAHAQQRQSMAPRQALPRGAGRKQAAPRNAPRAEASGARGSSRPARCTEAEAALRGECSRAGPRCSAARLLFESHPRVALRAPRTGAALRGRPHGGAVHVCNTLRISGACPQ